MGRQVQKSAFLMFVIGLFSITQIRIVGSIAISELIMFFIAPFVWSSNQVMFGRDRCNKFLFFCVLAMIGCVLSSFFNGIDMPRAIRGFATAYGFLASFIVFYPILRRDPKSFGWYLLGVAFSSVLCTFVFQGGYEMNEAENRGGGAEAIMSGPIYWIGRVGGFENWLICAKYMSLPAIVSIILPLAFGSFALLTTASGRSAALIAMAGCAMIVYAGKDVRKMRAIRKRLLGFAIGAVIVVSIFKGVYSQAAKTGALGEEAQKKYESQTRGGTDVLHLLMAGRGEAFLGLYYCAQRPIMGYGPWALDETGIYLNFFAKYGLAEDYEKMMQGMARSGMKTPWVGAHSAMLQFWLAYGILGMPVWIYIFYLMYDYLTKRIGSVPEFFGYFAVTLPGMLWAIFFSPFGGRIGWGFMLAMLLVNRAMEVDHKRMFFAMRRG